MYRTGISKGQNWVCMGKVVFNAVSKGLKQTCVSEDQGAHQAHICPPSMRC